MVKGSNVYGQLSAKIAALSGPRSFCRQITNCNGDIFKIGHRSKTAYIKILTDTQTVLES
jgi:hypothetical protein